MLALAGRLGELCQQSAVLDAPEFLLNLDDALGLGDVLGEFEDVDVCDCGYLALALSFEFAVEGGVFDAVAPVFGQRVGQLALLLENLPKSFIHIKYAERMGSWVGLSAAVWMGR